MKSTLFQLLSCSTAYDQNGVAIQWLGTRPSFSLFGRLSNTLSKREETTERMKVGRVSPAGDSRTRPTFTREAISLSASNPFLWAEREASPAAGPENAFWFSGLGPDA